MKTSRWTLDNGLAMGLGRYFRSASMGDKVRRWLEGFIRSAGVENVAPVNLRRERREPSLSLVSTVHVPAKDGGQVGQVMIYESSGLMDLKSAITSARTRLSELQASYTVMRHGVDLTQGLLFGLLRVYYQQLDQVKLVVFYRKRYLDALLQDEGNEAKKITEDYQDAKSQSDKEYDKAVNDLTQKKALSHEETLELQFIWKRLIKTYHPDRFADDPVKLAAFTQLVSEINRARDEGNINRLREIANDPNGFMIEQGLGRLDFADECEQERLQKLLEMLQAKVLETNAAIDLLKRESQYELHVLSESRPGYLQLLANERKLEIELEISQLTIEADTLKTEINSLLGSQASAI